MARQGQARDAAAAARPDWPARVQRLEAEVAGLRKAMRSRGLIEQAKGILAERQGIDPETAFARLSAQSQRENVPLINLAADLIGTAVPDEAGPAGEPMGRAAADPVLAAAPPAAAAAFRVVAGLADPDGPALPTALVRLLRRTTTATDAAADLHDIAQALVTIALGDEAGTAAAIFAAEPDGAVRLLASHGWPASVASEWQRSPSSVPTSVAAAIRGRRPILLDGHTAHSYVLIGPGITRAVYPLISGDRAVGALSLIWPVDRTFSPVERELLDRLAVAAGHSMQRLWPAELPVLADLSQQAWLATVLETVYSQGHVLTPVLDAAGDVTDFTIAAATAETARTDGDTVGRRLLDLYPNLLEFGAFAGYRELWHKSVPYVAEAATEETIIDGRPRRVIVNRRASRIGESVIAAWQRIDESVYRDERLQQLEALGKTGWAEWDVRAGDATWSPGLFRLLRREGGPTTLEKFGDLFATGQRRQYRQLLRELQRGRAASTDLRLLRDGESVDVRVIGAAELAEDGLRLVRLIVQDISEQRAAENRIARSETVSAARQLQLAQERLVNQALTQLLYPEDTVQLTLPTAEVAGSYFANAAMPAMRGDFCDAVALPDGGALLAVGDMFGVGLSAVAALIQLRYPALTLATAGLPPDRILAVLNDQLCAAIHAPLASLLVARYQPESATIDWASAGHLAPILIRDGTGTVLDSVAGPALGLMAGAEFPFGQIRLATGDIWACYTNGLVAHREAEPLQHLADRLAKARTGGGLPALLDIAPGATADDACLLAIEMTSQRRAADRSSASSRL